MALSGLDIYKLLPKTNCRECGFVTCLAFAMQLAKKAVSIDKCPYLNADARKVLEASSLPPIKLVTVGTGEERIEVGNETVLFRHEEKFHHPAAIGFIIEDRLGEELIKEKLRAIDQLNFERVGQQLKVNLIALKQTGDKKVLSEAARCVIKNTRLPLMLMSDDPLALKEVLGFAAAHKPLLYRATIGNNKEITQLAKEFNVPLVASAEDINALSALTGELQKQGLQDLVLEVPSEAASGRIWDLTQIRRQALKKSNRTLGYPVLVVIDQADTFDEIMEAAGYICKYAGLVLIKGIEPWAALSLLTLRQNIYTDPQKPLQIEPKLYAIGHTTGQSPVLVTTNFSLTYYTVLGEVEASKVPAYILSVDTEGMSVLTAWAAEKFNPEKIGEAMNKFAVAESVQKKSLIIPGYVAVMSGELQEDTGWQVVVGPKEASGIPSFLKNLQL